MKSRIYARKKSPREQTPDFSTTPAQPMFQSHPFVVQTQQTKKSQQPDLQTAYMRAERYGHHLGHITSIEPPTPTQAHRIVQAKLAIGLPGTQYEPEADRVAAQVVEQIHASDSHSSGQKQRKMEMGQPMAHEKAAAPQRIHNQRTGEAPIQRMMLVIGGNERPHTLPQIEGTQNQSTQNDGTQNQSTQNDGTQNQSTQNDEYITYAPGSVVSKYGGQGDMVKIPDKFGARGLKGWKNWWAKIQGDRLGTEEHGPRKSFKPQNDAQKYLSRLQPTETLKIVAHGTKSGKVGGYTPKKLVKLLVNLGLNKRHRGELDLHACLSAWHNNYKKKSTTFLVEEELKEEGINMRVSGFEGLIKTTQDLERPAEYELADLEYDEAVKKFKKSGGDMHESADLEGRPIRDTGDKKLEEAVREAKEKRDAIKWKDAVLKDTTEESTHWK